MEGDALEMEVIEANNGKVRIHQCNAILQSGTCFPPNPFGKYAIPGKPEWRAGVSCGLTEQGKYYCIIYNMPCHTWQPSSCLFPMINSSNVIISTIYKFYFRSIKNVERKGRLLPTKCDLLRKK